MEQNCILQTKASNRRDYLSWGEPFEQATALAEIGKRAQSIGLSVMTFTGYYIEQIEKQNNPEWKALYRVTN